MKKYSKKLLFFGILGIVLIILGTTFAFFNYYKMGDTSELITGNIYFNHTQGNTLTLQNEFPSKNGEARDRNDNVITLSVTGLNESSRDIYYKFLLSHGDDITGKNRINDKYLRFDLVEVLPNNEEKYILYAESFDTINETLILTDRVLAGTTSNTNRTFKLRMWVADTTKISDSDPDADYTGNAYKNLFASVKVTAVGDIPNVFYYNSLMDAAAAINSMDITSNLSRNNATIGIYKDSDDNSTNLVLYDDTDIDGNVTFNVPVNINLYGHTLHYKMFDNTTFTALTFNNTASLQNGNMFGDELDDREYYNYFIYYYHSGIMNNIDFPYIGEGITKAFIVQNSSNVKIENTNNEGVTIQAGINSYLKVINTHVDGSLQNYLNTTIELTDSYVESSRIPKVLIRVLESSSTLIVNNSTIFSDSPGCYGRDDIVDFYQISQGINNSGTLIFNSGYVFGTHSAVQTNSGSKTYVYGGTFESTAHGGFYFNHGSTGVAYIENANIGGVSYPANGKYRPNGTTPSSITIDGNVYTLGEYKTAFYMGGDTAQNNEKLYLVNCNIYAENQVIFVMRYSTPYQELYMSGCTIKSMAADPYFRIDTPSHMKLYSGQKNNFDNLIRVRDGNSVFYSFDTAKQNGSIVETYTTYKDAEKPS